MSNADEFRQRTRGTELLDVGTGSGGNIAIPAAQRGAKVVGVDVTPELFEHARRRARRPPEPRKERHERPQGWNP